MANQITLTLTDSEARTIQNALWSRETHWQSRLDVARLAVMRKQAPEVEPEAARAVIDMLKDVQRKVKTQIEEQGGDTI